MRLDRLNAVLIGFMSAGLVDVFFATGAFRAAFFAVAIEFVLCW
jgi:hypothetical protein